MKTVVFVNRAGRVSGAEVVMLRLIDAAVGRGYRVKVICPPGPLLDRLADSVERIPIDELDLGGSTGIARLRALIAVLGRWRRAAATIRRATGEDGEVIVNSLMALPAVRLARLRGGVSWLVHDTVSDNKQRLLIRVGAPAVRRAVAVSPPTADAVRALGVASMVSPLGVDVPSQREDHEQGDPPVVGIMGALTGWKGHRVLLQALAQIPDVECEIAGSAFHADQDYAEELQRLADAPPLAGRIRFLGHVDPLPVIRRWDVLVSASTSPEAGPIVALEAMSLGVPVVATDHGGSTWLLRDGAGVLVAPDDPEALADGIQRVLADADGLPAMLVKARERVVADHDAVTAFPAMLDALLDA